MQLQIEKEKLLPPVGMVAGVVERRQTLPILSYLLIRARSGEITMTGTDLEVEVIAASEGVVEDEGEVTVPARKLFDIARALPGGAHIKIGKQGNKVVLSAGRSRFSLSTLPVDDFPKVEAGAVDRRFAIPAGKLRRLLESAAFCMAQQDVRYYLNGLYVEIDEGIIRTVATDGHRMAVVEENHDVALPERTEVIIPRKAVQEVLRLLPDSEESIEIGIGGNHIRVQAPGIIFTSKLIDGKFPDYTKVIPAAQTKILTLDREAFRESLSRVAILANEKYRGVRLNVEQGRLGISAHNPEQEEATEEVETEYQGASLEIGFNVSYLIEAVGAIEGKEIVLGLNDPSSSCVIRAPSDQSVQYIIMPMRL